MVAGTSSPGSSEPVKRRPLGGENPGSHCGKSVSTVFLGWGLRPSHRPAGKRCSSSEVQLSAAADPRGGTELALTGRGTRVLTFEKPINFAGIDRRTSHRIECSGGVSRRDREPTRNRGPPSSSATSHESHEPHEPCNGQCAKAAGSRPGDRTGRPAVGRARARRSRAGGPERDWARNWRQAERQTGTPCARAGALAE